MAHNRQPIHSAALRAQKGNAASELASPHLESLGIPNGGVFAALWRGRHRKDAKQGSLFVGGHREALTATTTTVLQNLLSATRALALAITVSSQAMRITGLECALRHRSACLQGSEFSHPSGAWSRAEPLFSVGYLAASRRYPCQTPARSAGSGRPQPLGQIHASKVAFHAKVVSTSADGRQDNANNGPPHIAAEIASVC